MINIKKINEILDRYSNKKYITGLAFKVYDEKTNKIISENRGNIKKDSVFYIASTTKLFTSAIILQLVEENKIQLQTKVADLLERKIMDGLHVYKGVDYSKEITIRNLMMQTSGLPNYFSEHNFNKKSLEQRLTANIDVKYSFEDTIEWSKSYTPKFSPGKKGMAYYSDTNYQLLGRIIEVITNKTYHQNISERIINKLKLKDTYLYRNPSDTRPVALNYKGLKLNIPNAMASFGPDGGIVSNLDDLMIFIRSFFGNSLFDTKVFSGLHYNKIFFPLEYGLGFMRFNPPIFITAFKKIPALIGHSGLSGALAYYCPEKKIYIVGTVNQIYKPQISYNLITRILLST
jgi:CubicO group peptidase (beta-lactamase class C family)